MALTKLAVIIPTLNAGAGLEKLLDSLKSQDKRPDRIIIIDSGSEDQTIDLAERAGIKPVRIKRDAFDHGITRNLAAERTDADILIFMTQDVLPYDSTTISRLVEPLSDQSIVVSYARQLAGSNASVSEKYLRLANYPPVSRVKQKSDISEMGIRAFQSSNVCAAYRRREFEKLGRFPGPVVCNEDMIFAARAILAGYSVAYCAEAKVYHSHSYTAAAMFRRYFDIAASLDHEPQIMQNCTVETSGLDFFINQLRYMHKEKQLKFLPRVFIETAAKYLGYKCGLNHKYFNKGWKISLGMNRTYWNKN